ncbi:MAG: carbohydrate ABC transporter permease [Lactovum sp.]
MKEKRIAYLLMAPTALVLLVLVGYPIIFNLVISLQEVSLAFGIDSTFNNFKNYTSVLTDSEFWMSLLTTILYTGFVVIASTGLGLFVALMLSRDFYGKKIANALILVSYVVPSLASIYIFKYMFDTNYGIVNYFLMDTLSLVEKTPLWFDKPVLSFCLVTLFAVWRYFPYAYLSFYAILKTIDQSQYEAAMIDGATKFVIFRKITLPSVMPVLVTVVILRSIWMFYMYTDVALLTNQVDILGTYMYDKAFVSNMLGQGAAISVIMFAFIFPFTRLIRKAIV